MTEYLPVCARAVYQTDGWRGSVGLPTFFIVRESPNDPTPPLDFLFRANPAQISFVARTEDYFHFRTPAGAIALGVDIQGITGEDHALRIMHRISELREHPECYFTWTIGEPAPKETS